MHLHRNAFILVIDDCEGPGIMTRDDIIRIIRKIRLIMNEVIITFAYPHNYVQLRLRICHGGLEVRRLWPTWSVSFSQCASVTVCQSVQSCERWSRGSIDIPLPLLLCSNWKIAKKSVELFPCFECYNNCRMDLPDSPGISNGYKWESSGDQV